MAPARDRRLSVPAAAGAEPAPRGARRVALAFLDAVRAARVRLDHGEDREALHDFRVALRRLRSWLRALREDLDSSAPGGVRAALKQFAETSNRGRDAEVLIEWLDAAVTRLPARHRSAARWLRRLQAAERVDASRQLQHLLDASFDATTQRLERRLRRYRATVYLDDDGPPPESLAERVSHRARRDAGRLATLLDAISGVDDDSAIHEARIAGKRLRYLLEPLVKDVPSGEATIARLKRLQDTLGAIHDAHVWGEALHQTLHQAADREGRALRRIAARGTRARRRSALPGRAPLLSLAAAMHDHAAAEFATFESEWRGENRDAFRTGLDETLRLLASVTHPRQQEIERKFLLSGVPTPMPRARVVQLEQGYLPGARIIERLRKSTRGNRSTHVRTIKFGRGIVRTEVEEPTSAAMFATLWPLTEGKRVWKERRSVRDGAHTWEIDVFADRDLVLAEVELTRPDEEVPLPAWLAPFVVRDVTDEPAYLNYRLAR